MTLQLWAQPAPYLFFGTAALALLAVGGVIARRRRSAPQFIAPNEKATTMMDLTEAARTAYDIAKREQMPIAFVAEQKQRGGNAVAWFAQSIAGVVHVYRSKESGFEKIGAGSLGEDVQGLYIQKRDFQTYIRWARSMQ